MDGQVIGGLGVQIRLGRVDLKPIRAVQRAQQLVAAGEGNAVGPLHGADHDLVQQVVGIQGNDDLYGIVVTDEDEGIGVPAQLHVGTVIGEPLAVYQEGHVEEALGGDVAVVAMNLLADGEVVGLLTLCHGGEGGEGEQEAGQHCA